MECYSILLKYDILWYCIVKYIVLVRCCVEVIMIWYDMPSDGTGMACHALVWRGIVWCLRLLGAC